MKKLVLAAAIAIAILVVGLMPSQAQAAVVWSDDFNDGNIDGWTVHNGTISVTDGRAVATGTEPMYTNAFGDSYCNYMTHPSSMEFGNWTFEIHLDNNVHSFIAFLVHGAGILSYSDEASYPMIQISFGNDRLSLSRLSWATGYVAHAEIAGHDVPTENGLFQISVIRSDTYDFQVYLNGTEVIDASGIVPDETFNYFAFLGDLGSTLDNVIVSELVTTTTTPTPTPTPTTNTSTTTTTTTTDQPPDMTLISVGVGAAGVLIVVIVLVLKRK